MTITLLATPLLKAKDEESSPKRFWNAWYYITNKTGETIGIYIKDDPVHNVASDGLLLKNGETKKFFKDKKNYGDIKGPIRFFYASETTPDGNEIENIGEKFYEYSGPRYSSPQKGRWGVWTNKVKGNIELGAKKDKDGDRIPVLAQTKPNQNTRLKFRHKKVYFTPYKSSTAVNPITKVQEIKSLDWGEKEFVKPKPSTPKKTYSIKKIKVKKVK